MSVPAVSARVAELQGLIARLQGAVPAADAAPAAPGGFAAQLAGAAGAPPVAPESALPPGAERFRPMIAAAARRHGIDPALLTGLVRQESGFDPDAVSPAGATGLTQLMPGTARALGVTDPRDPAQALDGGARYLREQLDRFGGDVEKALAAYNAGPGAVQRFGGIPPYAETRDYVRKVLAYAREAGLGATGPVPSTVPPSLLTTRITT